MEGINYLTMLNVFAEEAANNYLRNYFKFICEKKNVEITSELNDFHWQFANFIRFGQNTMGYIGDAQKLETGLDDLICEAGLNCFASSVLREKINEKVLRNGFDDDGLIEIFELYKSFVENGCYIKMSEAEIEAELADLEKFFADYNK